VAYLDNDFEGQRLRVVGEGCGRGLKERPGLEFWSKKTRDLNAKQMTGVEGQTRDES